MATALVPIAVDDSMPMVPWRDSHTVSPAELSSYIQKLERACFENPRSADLRTCLGMAHAVNYDVYRSMDALVEATRLEPDNFWAQLKYAELHYRIRAMVVAEEATLRAIDVARNGWQLAIARKQLGEIRMLRHQGTRDVTWNKPLTIPTLCVAGMFVLMFAVMMWR